MQQSNKKMVKRRRRRRKRKKKMAGRNKAVLQHRNNKTKSGESCKCDEAEKCPPTQ
jgi:hypothetical protein